MHIRELDDKGACMFERDLSQRIRTMAEKYPLVSVTGPRQSGKSTLLKHLFPDYLYITLEDPDMRNFATEDPRFFLKTYDDKVILDEIQRTPDLFNYLQGTVDASRKTGQYLISGSQNHLIMQGITQSLAGRISITKLLPLSFLEAQKAGVSFESTFEWVWKGSYPRIYDKDISPIDYYPDYVQTHLNRDVKDFAGIRNLAKFETFVRLCANRIGSILDLTGLARESGVDVKTASSWLSALEESYILFRLPPYYRNFDKRLVKRPKLYFFDTGLACSLLGIQSPEQLISHAMKGSLFENAVLVELAKREYNTGRSPEFYFWQDSNKEEVDLIVEENGEPKKAIEIKSSSTYHSSYFENVEKFSQQANLLPENQMIIYAGENNLNTSKGAVINLFH